MCLMIVLVGCLGPMNMSYKGVTYYNSQEATTDGRISSNQPTDSRVSPVTDNDANINANTKVKTSDSIKQPEDKPLENK